MKLVIDIWEDTYKATCRGSMLPPHVENVVNAIKNGILLSKEHGKIVDIGKIDNDRIERDNPVIQLTVNGEYIEAVSLDYLNSLPAIIEAESKRVNMADNIFEKMTAEERDQLWMYMLFNKDKILDKTEEWSKKAKEAGMTLTEYLESINPLDTNKEGQLSWLGKNCKDCGNKKCKELGELPKGYDCALWQPESENK